MAAKAAPAAIRHRRVVALERSEFGVSGLEIGIAHPLVLADAILCRAPPIDQKEHARVVNRVSAFARDGIMIRIRGSARVSASTSILAADFRSRAWK
jgi:hypothetical protein